MHFHDTRYKLANFDLEYHTRLPGKLLNSNNYVTCGISLQGNTLGSNPDPSRLSHFSEVYVATQQCVFGVRNGDQPFGQCLQLIRAAYTKLVTAGTITLCSNTIRYESAQTEFIPMRQVHVADHLLGGPMKWVIACGLTWHRQRA